MICHKTTVEPARPRVVSVCKMFVKVAPKRGWTGEGGPCVTQDNTALLQNRYGDLKSKYWTSIVKWFSIEEGILC